MKKTGRMRREAATVELMIRRYCGLRHIRQGKTSELCEECAELLRYSNHRLANCPFQEGKTTCGKCAVHCYKPEKREKIREVMRVIGPRMFLTNPLMALQHLIDGLRREPIKKIHSDK